MWPYVHLAQETEFRISLSYSRELHSKAAIPILVRFHSLSCVTLGRGWCPLSLCCLTWRTGAMAGPSPGCGEEGLTAFSLPPPLCPQPSATSLFTGFLGCRLYLIEEKTKAEGIKSTVPEAWPLQGTLVIPKRCLLTSNIGLWEPQSEPCQAFAVFNNSTRSALSGLWVKSQLSTHWLCDLGRVRYVSVPWVPQT